MNVTEEQLQSQAEQLSNLSPDQLRQQAQMLKTMDPAVIRRMNPQMAGLTDAQIRMAATQFEMMANNPEMVKMAAEQMKGMSPEDVEGLRSMQEGMTGGGGSASVAGGADGMFGGMDPAKLMESMDAKQVKASLKMIRENPDLIKKMMADNPAAAKAGVSEEQMLKGLEMFDKMDEKQIDMAMGMMKTANKVYSPLARAWRAVDNLVGGNLARILQLGAAFLLARFVAGYFGLTMTPAPEAASSVIDEQPGGSLGAGGDPYMDEDEFASEF